MRCEWDVLAPEEQVSLALRERYERYGYKKVPDGPI